MYNGRVFRISGLKKYFDDIIIFDEIGVAKPAVEFFELAFKAMGDPVKRSVMIIGDSLTSDMAGGVQYGIDTCWYNPQQIENKNKINVTYEIFELHELMGIVNAP